MIQPATAETILVADDCKDICELIEVLLFRAGYRVLTATSGPAALEIARQSPEIELLISNVEMPGMRGDELAQRFTELNPQAAVLFLSSWDDPAGAAQARLLSKPFTVTQLREIVRRALAKRAARNGEPAARFAG